MNTPLNHLLKREMHRSGARTSIVTANQRQSRMLRELYSQHQSQTFQLPTICTLTEWIQRLCDERQMELDTKFNKTILTKDQNLWVWTQLLDLTDDMPPLLDSSTVAKQLHEAEELEEQFLLNLSAYSDGLTSEVEFYVRLKEKKSRLMTQLNCVTQSQAVTELTKYYKNKISKDDIYVFGFVEVPPVYIKLIESISGSLNILHDNDQNEETKRIALYSKEDETSHAINWAKHIFEHHPDDSIAIVASDLHLSYRDLQRKFFKALEPEKYLLSEQPLNEIFDISVAEPLTNISIISDAIALLSLFEREIPKETARQLLVSPYWGEENSEADVVAYRYSIAKRLAEFSDNNIAISSLLNLLARQSQDKSGLLVSATNIRSKLSEKKQNRFVSDWVTWYLNLLTLGGWPGKADLSSREYQHLQTFLSTLNSLCQYDHIQHKPASFYEFKRLLTELCHSQSAQLEIQKPKIRILGLMEAAGQRFDHCLILGLTDSVLPQRAKPNAFLPIQLQKDANTPRSSFERETVYAQNLLKSIKSGARNLVLSRHMFDGDEEKPPSPLLPLMFGTNEVEIPKTDLRAFGFEQLVDDKQHFLSFERVTTGNAPLIEKGYLIKGGVAHINAHWANPLFSFFKFRLRIDKTNPPTIGLSPQARGNLIHLVLQAIYSHHKDSETIKEHFYQDTFHSDLAFQIRQAWKTLWPETGSIPLILEKHEKNKIADLITQFIKLDVSRSHAFKVESTESKRTLNLAGYDIDLRIDRVDRDTNNHCIIFDYKTGKTSLNGISKSDTTDFQLPLYAIAHKSDNVAAVSFAEINDKDVRFNGVGSENINIHGIHSPHKIRYSELPENWIDTIEYWQTNALRIVGDISTGVANYIQRNTTTAAYTEHYEPSVRPEERDMKDD